MKKNNVIILEINLTNCLLKNKQKILIHYVILNPFDYAFGFAQDKLISGSINQKMLKHHVGT